MYILLTIIDANFKYLLCKDTTFNVTQITYLFYRYLGQTVLSIHLLQMKKVLTK